MILEASDKTVFLHLKPICVLTGIGEPGPPGEKGAPGSFVPTSGW